MGVVTADAARPHRVRHGHSKDLLPPIRSRRGKRLPGLAARKSQASRKPSRTVPALVGQGMADEPDLDVLVFERLGEAEDEGGGTGSSWGRRKEMGAGGGPGRLPGRDLVGVERAQLLDLFCRLSPLRVAWSRAVPRTACGVEGETDRPAPRPPRRRKREPPDDGPSCMTPRRMPGPSSAALGVIIVFAGS